MGNTHLVRDAAELNAIWGQVEAGDTINLASGDYGDALIRRVEFDTPVTIKSADVDNPAVFETLSIFESKGLVVENVGVVLQVDENTPVGVRGIYITGSEDVTVRDNMIVGGDAVVGVSTDTDPATLPPGTPYLGEPIGNAVYITGSEDINIAGNEITGFQRGITVLGSDEVLVSDNNIHDMRGTPFRSNGSNNVTVEGNEFSSFFPVNFGGYGDHGDFIHFWEPAAEEPVTNLVVRDNFFHQGEGTVILGIVFSTPSESVGFRNVTVENNVIHNGDRAGIVLENVHDANIANNTLVQNGGDDTRTAPGIRIDFASSDIVVEDNIASEVAIIGDRVDEDSITIRNNVDIQSHNPQDINYVSDVLVNGLVDPAEARLSDFALVPGFGNPNVGANIQSNDAVFFSAQTTSSDRSSLSTVLNVEELAGTDANYTFRFADGTTAEGTEVRHEFAEAGRHEVTLIAVVDGRTETVTRTVEVFDPVKFDLDNLSQFGDKVSTLGDAEFAGGQLTFGGSAAQIKVSQFGSELEDLSEFSAAFSVSFSEESADRETLVRVTNYFTMMAQEEKLTALVWLSDGSIAKLEAEVPGLQDGNTFDLSFTFDELNGVASLHVNGDEVAREDGIQEAMGAGGNAPLYIGGFGSGSNFNGTIDNLTIRTDSDLAQSPPVSDETIPEEFNFPDFPQLRDSSVATPDGVGEGVDLAIDNGRSDDMPGNFRDAEYASILSASQAAETPVPAVSLCHIADEFVF